MATSTAPEKAEPKTQPVRLPPEEKFWQRYSAHQEMPLSTVASFALHLLGIGGLILVAWMGWFGFGKSSGSLPVEPVRFATGGGGGKPQGVGNEKGIGTGAEPVDATETKTDPEPTPEDDAKRPTLDPAALALAPKEVQNDDTIKRLVQSGNPNLNIFKQVEASTLSKLRDGLNPGKGRGGSGSGGGKGEGTGMGEGDGRGEGKNAALSQREKRMLRWSMIFDTRTGKDYLHQLRSLGAILAVPTAADGKTYKILRDLSGVGPPKLLEEDISKIQCIFWIDDRPESVASLMHAINYQGNPGHFVAFMPLKLEQELFEMEKKFAGRTEDQIHETKFKAVRRGNTYKPIVIDQKGR